jgi:hypothetical protein
MKRFDMYVEDMLIDKYGIPFIGNCYKVYFGYDRGEQELRECDMRIALLLLLGILEYELWQFIGEQKVSYMHLALLEAHEFVRAEIKKLQRYKKWIN